MPGFSPRDIRGWIGGDAAPLSYRLDHGRMATFFGRNCLRVRWPAYLLRSATSAAAIPGRTKRGPKRAARRARIGYASSAQMGRARRRPPATCPATDSRARSRPAKAAGTSPCAADRLPPQPLRRTVQPHSIHRASWPCSDRYLSSCDNLGRSGPRAARSCASEMMKMTNQSLQQRTHPAG